MVQPCGIVWISEISTPQLVEGGEPWHLPGLRALLNSGSLLNIYVAEMHVAGKCLAENSLAGPCENGRWKVVVELGTIARPQLANHRTRKTKALTTQHS
jgi:hypothetical protein